MASKNKTSQARARTLEREAKAFQLRKKGASYTEIARSLRISRQGAHKLVTAVFEQLESELGETVPTVRRMEIERLDEMLFAIWPKVKKGDLPSIDRALKISERRSKILGIDMPIAREVSGPDGGRMSIALLDKCMEAAQSERRHRISESA